MKQSSVRRLAITVVVFTLWIVQVEKAQGDLKGLDETVSYQADERSWKVLVRKVAKEVGLEVEFSRDFSDNEIGLKMEETTRRQIIEAVVKNRGLVVAFTNRKVFVSDPKPPRKRDGNRR